ncbi:MAG: SPFH domain-containing protein, partial [Pseudonocardiaceae bacterium]
PSDFGKALEGFSKMLGAPGDDGVFRFEPSRDYVSSSRPEDDDDAVADWFDTSTDPHIAAEVRAAEEVARREVPGPEVGTTPSLDAASERSDSGGSANSEQQGQPPGSAETTAPQEPVPPEQQSGERSANSAHPPDDQNKPSPKRPPEPPQSPERNGG